MTKLIPLPIAALATHLAIVGRTGSGKTYAAKGLVERLLDEKRRVCILDPTGAWYGLRSSVDGKRPGYPVAVFGGSHGDVHIAEHSGEALAKIIANKNLPAIIDLSEMLIGQRHRFVTDFCETLYRENRTALHLVIDEADEFCPQNPMPETKRMLHHVDRIVRRGRIRGFRVMLITQRPAVLHKNVLTQANTLIAMRLTAPQDRKAILAWVEGQADTAKAKVVLDSLARLQRGEAWVWAPEQDTLERVTFPKISTFDSSRAPDDNEVIAEPTRLASVDIEEIKASFDEIEKEVRTLAELKAENDKLKRQVVWPIPSGISEEEVTRRIQDAISRREREVCEAFEQVSRRLAECIDAEKSALLAPRIPTESHKRPQEPTKQRQTPQINRWTPAGRSAGADTAASGAALPSGERTVLTAIAQHQAGVSREQLTVLTGYKRSTRDAYLQRLRERGMILIEHLIVATFAGLRALGSNFQPLPTGRALFEHWVNRLPEGEAKILRLVCQAFPGTIYREELGTKTGYARSSRDAYLQRLKSRQLITVSGDGIRASQTLFD